MKVTVLGSGTLLPDSRRHSASHYVETGTGRILLDCGPGTHHGMSERGVPWTRLTHLFLTHFHTDHTGDLAALLFALTHGPRPPRTEALVLAAPGSWKGRLRALAEAHGPFVLEPGFPLEVLEIPEDPPAGWCYSGPDFRVTARATGHTEAALAYRIEGTGGSVGYTGDTGPDPELGRFLAGVDVLISECSQPDPPEFPRHLSPSGVAVLGRTARPGLLVLTHVYPSLDRDRLPDLVRAAGYEGPLTVARDGDLFRTATFPGARPGP